MRRPSLRRHLLAWLMIPLLAGWGVNGAITYFAAVRSVNEAFDRTLLGAALAIAERVYVDGGRIAVDLPYAALEMLETNAQERVFYKVSVASQGVVTGYDDLPAPRVMPRPKSPTTFEADYKGERVRVLNVLRPIYDPVIKEPALIQIGETLETRSALSRRLLIESAAKELVLVLAAGLLVWLAVRRGLAPLRRLRQEVLDRARDDLSPIDTREVPREVAPLVEAINEHTARQRQMIEVQRRFIADASHQLKTPLTVLGTQAELALRQPDLPGARAILEELRANTQATTRVVQQLLALARSEPGQSLPMEPLDLTGLARETSFDWLKQALARPIDLGFDGAVPLRVRGHRLLLRELLANLIDNALRYTAPHSAVTVRVCTRAGQVALEVEDNGPGIPAAERERVFERFYRVPGNTAEGCGLGLAIVKEIAAAHGAVVSLESPAHGRGLRVVVLFPALALA